MRLDNLIIGVCLLITGCSSTVQYTKEKEFIKVKLDTLFCRSPDIREEIKLLKINDSLYNAFKIDEISKDTVVNIVYNKNRNNIRIRARPEKIRIIKADTITTKILESKEIIEKKNIFERFFEKIELVLAIGLIIIIYLIIKKGEKK